VNNRQGRRQAERRAAKLRHPSRGRCGLCGALIASEGDRDTPARLEAVQGPVQAHWWCAGQLLAEMEHDCPICRGEHQP
jgi:hypothetical protein